MFAFAKSRLEQLGKDILEGVEVVELEEEDETGWTATGADGQFYYGVNERHEEQGDILYDQDEDYTNAQGGGSEEDASGQVSQDGYTQSLNNDIQENQKYAWPQFQQQESDNVGLDGMDAPSQDMFPATYSEANDFFSSGDVNNYQNESTNFWQQQEVAQDLYTNNQHKISDDPHFSGSHFEEVTPTSPFTARTSNSEQLPRKDSSGIESIGMASVDLNYDDAENEDQQDAYMAQEAQHRVIPPRPTIFSHEQQGKFQVPPRPITNYSQKDEHIVQSTYDASSEASNEPSFFSSPMRSVIGKSFLHLSKLRELAQTPRKSTTLEEKLRNVLGEDGARDLSLHTERELDELDRQVMERLRSRQSRGSRPPEFLLSEDMTWLADPIKTEGLSRQSESALDHLDRRVYRVWAERKVYETVHCAKKKDEVLQIIERMPSGDAHVPSINGSSIEPSGATEQTPLMHPSDPQNGEHLMRLQSTLNQRLAQIESRERAIDEERQQLEEEKRQCKAKIERDSQALAAREQRLAVQVAELESRLCDLNQRKDTLDSRSIQLDTREQALHVMAKEQQQQQDATYRELDEHLSVLRVQNEMLLKDSRKLQEQILGDEQKRVLSLMLSAAAHELSASAQTSGIKNPILGNSEALVSAFAVPIDRNELNATIVQQALIASLQEQVYALKAERDKRELRGSRTIPVPKTSPEDNVGQTLDQNPLSIVSAHYSLISKNGPHEALQELSGIEPLEVRDATSTHYDQLVSAFTKSECIGNVTEGKGTERELEASISRVAGFVQLCAQQLSDKNKQLDILALDYYNLSQASLKQHHDLQQQIEQIQGREQSSWPGSKSPTEEKSVGANITSLSHDKAVAVDLVAPSSPTEDKASGTEYAFTDRLCEDKSVGTEHMTLEPTSPTEDKSVNTDTEPTVDKSLGQVPASTTEDKSVNTDLVQVPRSPTEDKSVDTEYLGEMVSQAEDDPGRASETDLMVPRENRSVESESIPSYVAVAQRLQVEIKQEESTREPLKKRPVSNESMELEEAERNDATTAKDLVDKRLTASVVTTMIERNCRHDCVEVVASVLDFTEDERRRAGLSAPASSGGFFSSIFPDWSRSQARAQTLNPNETSFSNLISDFVLDEIS